MTQAVRMAFQPEVIEVAIEDILPLKTIKAAIKKTAKYRQVFTSIKEVGIIEHPWLSTARRSFQEIFCFCTGTRAWNVLKSMGEKTVHCLIERCQPRIYIQSQNQPPVSDSRTFHDPESSGKRSFGGSDCKGSRRGCIHAAKGIY